jgi:transcriptional regulator of heat shock response
MPELTERQRTILLLLIRDYIETAQPVGSKRLVERVLPPSEMKCPR